MLDHDETFSKIILEYMNKVQQASPNALLHYVNILEKLFEYFKVPLQDEESINVVDTMINKVKLDALKFKCTSSRQ